jgi:hypothetical protein
MGELSQAGAAAMDTLKNDTQRAMYAPILARNMGMFQSRMQQHRNGQVRVWNTNEARARAQVNGDNAIFAYEQRDEVDENGREIGMIRYEAYVQTALDEARKAGELMGYAPGSAQMKLLEQEVNDRIAAGVVQSLVSQGKFADAQAFLDNEGTVEVLAPKAKEALNNSVQVKREASVINDLTDSIRETGTLNSKADPKTYGQEAKEGAEPPATLREALELADGIADPEVRKAVQSQLRTQYAQQEALVTQEYRAVLARRDEWVANPANNPAAFPQIDLLTESDRMKTYAMPQSDDPRVLNEIAIDPSKVSDPKYMESIQYRVSPQTMLKLREAASKPEKIIEAQVDADDINRQLIDMGMSQYVSTIRGSTNSQRALIFRNNITQMIEIRQREKGGKISPDEKRDIIRKAIVDEAWIRRSGMDERLPRAMMTQEEIGRSYVIMGDEEVPPLQYAIAEQQLRDAGISSPSQSQIINVWITKGRPR